jgi:hypothetical protein
MDGNSTLTKENCMSVEDLRKCTVATPFLPFTLNIADGRSIPVVGRDFILIPPDKGRMFSGIST